MLAQKLHKPVIKKFQITKVYAKFEDNCYYNFCYNFELLIIIHYYNAYYEL